MTRTTASNTPPQTPVQVVCVVPPKVHLLDITGPAHIFYEAITYGAPIKLFFSNIHAQETSIESSSSLSLSRLTDFNTLQLNKGDLIFIPGLEVEILLDDRFLANTSRPFQQWIREQHARGIIVCSVCTGAYLLAEAGLLNGRSCTTHWKYFTRFANRYPQVQLQQNRLFIKEDNIYTSAGVASGIDLALHIIEQLFGAHFAALIAKEVVVFLRRTPDDPQLSVFMQYRNHLDDRIHQVQDILANTLEKKLNIEDLALQVHMSGRNLTRLFRKTTTISIGQYTDRLRTERARQLLREGHTLQTTANLCGLKSTNQLRDLLKKSA